MERSIRFHAHTFENTTRVFDSRCKNSRNRSLTRKPSGNFIVALPPELRQVNARDGANGGCRMKLQTYVGDYAGDIYVASNDVRGALFINHDGKEQTIPAKAAKPIIAELERASGPESLYGDFEIAAIHHFILERAFAA
jgi:hypothetical protein